MISTKDIKIKFLGVTPVLKDETGILTPQQLVAFSGLLTYSGRSIESLLKESLDKGQDISKKIRVILRKSSLKGHASMATTPAIAFSYEASKFIDSAFTGLVFASAIMASGRRTDTVSEDIVYPRAIESDLEACDIYRSASEKNIELSKHLLAAGIGKDEASKILQYGIYGTGIIQIPIESFVSLKREYEAQKEWMPEDAGYLIAAIEKELKKFGVDLLYATRVVAPRNTYPYPNIFKNPAISDLARDVSESGKVRDNFKLLSHDFIATSGLRARLENLKKRIDAMVRDQDDLANNWADVLEERQQIARDYASSVSIKVFSNVAWRVWGDKKRHRTVPMVVESVYHCAKIAANMFDKYRRQISDRSLSHPMIDDIDTVFSLPPAICADPEFLYEYIDAAMASLDAYNKLVKIGIKERDAIFVVPRGLKLGVVSDYNLYNLISGYYPLRMCSTAEEELRRVSLKEVIAIKNLLQENGLGYVAEHIVPKCQAVGFCLEEPCCGIVKNLVTNYSDECHRRMHSGLEDKFTRVLGEINGD